MKRFPQSIYKARDGYSEMISPSSSTVGSSNTDQHTEVAMILNTGEEPKGSNNKSKTVYKMDGATKEGDAAAVEQEQIVNAVSKGLRSQENKSSKKSVKTTKQRRLPPPKQSNTSNRRRQHKKRSTSASTTSSTSSGRPPKSLRELSTRERRKKLSSSRSKEVPVVSDDDESTEATSDNGGFPGLLHRMIYDESTTGTSENTSKDSNDADFHHNYIDDDSYGQTSNSSSSTDSRSYSSESGDSTVSASSVESVTDRRRNGGEGMGDDFHDSDNSTASLTSEVESSFEQHEEAVRAREQGLDEYAKHRELGYHDDDKHAYRYSRGDAPQGLDIVAHLLANAKEMTLDASSIMDRSDARHVADALGHTTALEKISFCGPWKKANSRQKLVLEILLDGLLENTSVHTIIIRDNHYLDRYAGFAFGTLLKAQPSNLQKLELIHCRFVGSGWNTLFMGLQHNSLIKRLSVEDCSNLKSDDIDAITSTIQYLQLEFLKLCGVNLHKIHLENLSILLRSIQQTKSLKEVDLSKNNFGGVPRAVLLLSKCLSGDPVGLGSDGGMMESSGDSNHLPLNYYHHIEKLSLADCGIVDKSSVRTLAKALDSTLAKFDSDGLDHPLVLQTLDLSHNQFGNSGARIIQLLVENNPKITTLGMVGCGVSASHLKNLNDHLRYNNSFLQKIGLSSGVSLAILDSVSAVERVFNGSNGNGTTAGIVEGDDGSDVETGGTCGGGCQ